VRQTLDFLSKSDYFFLRALDGVRKGHRGLRHDVEASSVVSAMTMSCRGAAIRVSGSRRSLVRRPASRPGGQSLFEGFTMDDVAWMGGESIINETVGLGGFAQAAAFPCRRTREAPRRP